MCLLPFGICFIGVLTFYFVGQVMKEFKLVENAPLFIVCKNAPILNYFFLFVAH